MKTLILVALMATSFYPIKVSQTNQVNTVVKNSYEERAFDDVDKSLEKIAYCESGNRHFLADGSVIRGRVNPKDLGRYQINEHYHLKESIAMGIDIYSEEGNYEYARRLFEESRGRHWKASYPCHGIE